MKVIRIEHPSDGLGFFRSKTNSTDDTYSYFRMKEHSHSDDISNRHQNPWKFPNFADDEELNSQFGDNWGDIYNYNFGYLSLEQLREGFTNEELKEAIEVLGFRVLMYDVDRDYFKSKFQVVFIKSSTNSVEDISSLFL